MSSRIFRCTVLVAGVVLIASFTIIMGYLYEYFAGVQAAQVKDELTLAAAAVEDGGYGYLKKIKSDSYRITLIDADGKVIYDTRADAADMENHSDRFEVREALKTGEGESSRYSSTLLEKTYYRAKRLSDGSILRISLNRATAGVLLLGMLHPLIIILVAALILSGVMAGRLSKRIVEPLNALDLDHPLENDAYAEISPLLNRINRQRVEISRQLAALERQNDEFTQIIENMKEALVLLDEKGRVISVNPAARALFSIDGDSCVGADFLSVDRSREVSLAIRQAFSEGRGETRLERKARAYRLDASRIDSAAGPVGAVVLAYDVTEREYAERNRREFTANVSHELKTPLQGITGSAELIEKGMVAPEDVPRFVGHIREEAARMVTLVGDIIRLSQLDEGAEMPRERVDLLQASREAADVLRDEAAKRNISIAVGGEQAFINGSRGLINETLYNLCDNAVKYNVEGGSVDITVSCEGKTARVLVADTGTGIPPEDQSRVFERFYRVDKSHSKASGGTGLGLSIVKHAVQRHGGTINLKSEPGKGTRITLEFPTA